VHQLLGALLAPHAELEVILVAVFGNALAGDDALGPAVVECLGQADCRGLKILDASQAAPLSLLDHLEGLSGLILVDAVTGPDISPGQIIDADWLDQARPAVQSAADISSHGFSLPQQMDMAAKLGLLPQRVRLIGVGLGNADLGQPLSPAVHAAVGPVVERIIARQKAWSTPA
jgi:hydrogenase maturation protease